jgi:hypothetical protein
MLTTRLIKRIKTLQRAAGVRDEEYRALLSGYNVQSCKDLNPSQAADVISFLQRISGSKIEPVPLKKRYNDLGRRTDMATPKQLRMLEAIWMDVTVQRTRSAAIDAYHAWLKNRFSIGSVEWIESGQVGKIKHALEAMRSDFRA